MNTEEIEARIKRREIHIENLRKMKDIMLESDNWENMKNLIDAVTAGAFALARLNKEDEKEIRNRNER